MTQAPETKLTDHSYDGIQEYDNPTPGWWVAIFVFSIIFSLLYGIFFHFSPDASNVKQSYDESKAAAAKKKYAKWGELKFDEPSLLTYMQDPEKVLVGQSIFKMNCAGCHASDGSGQTGPNMTDEHYKNVKVLTDIAKVIRSGANKSVMPPKGGADLSENDIACVATYIATLRGKNRPGQPPEGEKIAPWPEAPKPAATRP